MLSGTVTNRYTLGLFDVANQHGVVDNVEKSLTLLADAIVANSELKNFLNHPLIASDQKVSLVRKVFGEQLEPVVYRFLTILFGRGRSAYVVDIARRFAQIAEAAKGTIKVEVESAQPLSEAAVEALEAQLSASLKKQAKAVVTVNPDLIAGYRVRVGNRVLNATIFGALAQFSDKLLAGKGH